MKDRTDDNPLGSILESMGQQVGTVVQTVASWADNLDQELSTEPSSASAPDAPTSQSDGAATTSGTLVHTVEEGQHISAIAERYSFANFETIWNAPENAKLRSVREDPHQLLPGDEVIIPSKKPKTFARETGKTHEFRVHVEKLKLRLRILDLAGKPVANKAGVLTIEGTVKSITTDGEGTLTERISRTARHGRLEIAGYTFELAVGGLGPISEPHGQAERLANLGLWRGNSVDMNDGDAQRFATELFQNARRMAPDGTMSSELMAALSSEYDGEA